MQSFYFNKFYNHFKDLHKKLLLLGHKIILCQKYYIKKLDKMQGILYVKKKLICGMSDKIWYNDMKLKKL